MPEPFTSQDHHVPRPDVPGHALTRRADGRLFIVVCSCGWESEPLHLSNLIGAENQHRIEVSP